MTFFLEFRLNACPICLICLDCQNEYGQKCTCQAREVKWKKKKDERDYKVDFFSKPLTQKGATNQKVLLDSGFVKWVFANVSSHIELSSQNNVNICLNCMNIYRGKNKSRYILYYIILLFIFIYKFILTFYFYLISYKKQANRENYKFFFRRMY